MDCDRWQHGRRHGVANGRYNVTGPIGDTQWNRFCKDDRGFARLLEITTSIEDIGSVVVMAGFYDNIMVETVTVTVNVTTVTVTITVNVAPLIARNWLFTVTIGRNRHSYFYCYCCCACSAVSSLAGKPTTTRRIFYGASMASRTRLVMRAARRRAS